MISFHFYRRVKQYIARIGFKIFFSSKFKGYGRKVAIINPDTIQGEEYISLGDNVIINSMTWLLALKQDDNMPNLSIEKNVNIGRFSHIVALKRVIIKQNVLIADKVYISDNIHNYEDVAIPIIEQAILFKGDVEIGEDSWIGENVSIIGVKIGKHCVIGANSVVTNDIPDYCVAVGVPAKVIKQYNLEEKKWQSI